MSFLTVIVPCLDEAANLDRLLPGLVGSGSRVIVVDGGSRDDSVARARAAGAEVLRGRAPRAAQLNLGASRAGSDVLLFLHADARPPEDFAARIRDALRDPAVVGGAFDLAIDQRGLAPWLVSRAASLRSRITRSPYGDQGLFVRRAVFEALGGFAPWPFMEDLELSHRLHKRGRIRLLRPPVVVSARRWQAQGYARTTLRNAILAGCFYLGINPSRFARWVRPVREGVSSR